MASESISVTTSDDQTIQLSRKHAQMSQTINSMLEDSVGADQEAIPLPNVSSEVLKKVIDWCTHHENDPAPVEKVKKLNKKREYKAKNSTISDEWDKNFVNAELRVIVDILLAANYLDVKGLFELMCKHIANELKGKTPDQIRERFGIQDDLTEEDKAAMRKAWGATKNDS
ncbi:S-phase kinase-associated protein 1 [Planoprotostelium fungivorum]|uniref:S-phase kinase-associated protein 1 n=1 Tax=Planoprotostelium fungivorum TaxID=1890364 RepID=A0A2P6NPT9_9EUKA|nr:S-phase kinase-associated protein 1 [Planoprotostelium fungivorum]